MKNQVKKIVVLCLALSLACGFALAQEEDSETASNSASGKSTKLSNEISGTNAAGAFLMTPVEWDLQDFFYGICYQRWIVPQFALEFGGMIVGSGVNEMSYNFMVEGDWAFFQHVSNKNFATRLFLWGLLGHSGEVSTDNLTEIWDSNTQSSVPNPNYGQTSYSFNIRGSLGVGFEMVIAQHISIPMKFGVSAGSLGFGFTFGTGIKYLW